MLVIRDGLNPIELRTGDEPYQVCILIGAGLWGCTSLATLGKVTTTTTRTLPLWSVYVFFALMAAGCVAALVGVAYQVFLKKFLGFHLERAGQLELMSLCAAYAVWALAASGARALGFAYIMLAIAAAAAWRTVRISKGLRDLRQGGDT
jgi:hypothetical protein